MCQNNTNKMCPLLNVNVMTAWIRQHIMLQSFLYNKIQDSSNFIGRLKITLKQISEISVLNKKVYSTLKCSIQN